MRCWGWAAQGRRRALFTSYELTRVSPFLPPFPFPFFRAAPPPGPLERHQLKSCRFILLLYSPATHSIILLPEAFIKKLANRGGPVRTGGKVFFTMKTPRPRPRRQNAEAEEEKSGLFSCLSVFQMCTIYEAE